MKYFLAFMFAFFGVEVHGQVELEWQHPMEFSELLMPGQKHIFMQECAKDMDSVIANGKAAFRKASLGDIKQMYLAYIFSDTILISTEMKTRGVANGKALNDKIAQLTIGFKPVINSIDGKKVRKVYVIYNNNKKYLLEYYTNRKFSNSTLKIFRINS